MRIVELMSSELGIGTEKVLQRILEASYALVDAERISLFEVDPHSREIICRLSRDEQMKGLRIPAGSGIVGHVALTGRPLNIPDAYADARFDRAGDSKTGYRTRSILTVPVIDSKGTIAVIQAMNKRSGEPFSSEDESLLTSMAVSAGIILHKSQLLDLSMSSERKFRALTELVMIASREDGKTDEIMTDITKVAYDALCADRITIYFVDQVKGELCAVVCADAEGWTVPISRGIAGLVARTGELINVPDAWEHPKFDPANDMQSNYRTYSVLCAPVKNKNGEVMAVIQCINKRKFGSGSASAHHSQSSIASLQAAASSASSAGMGKTPGTNRRSLRASGNLQQILSTRGPAPASSMPPPAAAAGAAPTKLHLELPNHSSPSIFPMAESPLEESNFLPFSSEDEEILRTVCAEIRSLLLRHIRDALFNRHQSRMKASIQEQGFSMLDLWLGSASTTADSVASPFEEVISPLTPQRSNASHASATSGTGKAPAATFISPMTSPTQSSPQQQKSQPADENVITIAFRTRPINRPSIEWSLPIGVSMGALESLDFNVWEYSHEQLVSAAWIMIRDLDAFHQIPQPVLREFLQSVAENYHDNPFHNWHHGFSVMHFAWLCCRQLMREECTKILSSVEILSMLIAALCHDLQHPGHTNAYEVNIGSDLALLHHDTSVLEQHHAVSTLRLLRNPERNILAHLSPEQVRSCRKMIVGAILATDMVHHFEQCKTLGSRDPDNAFNAAIDADRQMFVNTIVHAADLSAQTLSTRIAVQWELRISQEFMQQAEKERAAGIPVAPFMQSLNDPCVRNDQQVKFIDFVLSPWWQPVSALFPGTRPCYRNLLENRGVYASRVQQPEAADK